jgi:hypothetical protein
MKYKNIPAAIHNFGHSFLSLMNYVNGNYVIDDIDDIISKGYDIKIDWLNNTFHPQQQLTSRLSKSIKYYSSHLKKHLQSHSVEIEHIVEINLYYPANGRKYMWAVDDRGKEYRIYISELK